MLTNAYAFEDSQFIGVYKNKEIQQRHIFTQISSTHILIVFLLQEQQQRVFTQYNKMVAKQY